MEELAMKKLTVVLVLCTVLTVSLVGAQEKRIYNNGEIDYVPLGAKIALHAEDKESSLQYIEYSVNGESVKRYEGPVKLPEEGRYFIGYRAVDNMGNISKEKVYSCYVDGTAPYLMGAANGPAYMVDNEVYLTSNTGIVVSGDDELSGVQAIYVALDDNNYFRYTGTSYITEEGKHTGKAYAVDNVGNKSKVYSITGYVDNTPPTVKITPKKRIYDLQGDRYSTPDNSYRVTATDEISGVKEIMVSIDNREYVSYSEPVSLRDEGYRTIRAKAVDYLGNESDEVILSLYVDDKVPVIEHEVLID